MTGYLKRRLSFMQPGLMLDANDAPGGGDPPKTPEGQTPPHAEGNGGMSQEELDRKFSERATRAAEGERKKLWEALGVTTQDEFDAFVKAKKEREDAQKTEAQRLADDAKREKERADKLEADSKSKLEAMQNRIVDSEIKLLASKPAFDKDGNILRPAFHPDVLEDIPAFVKRDGIKDEEGKTVGIEEALTELAKAKPRLLDDSQQADTSKAPGTPKGPVKPKQKTAETEKPKWTL